MSVPTRSGRRPPPATPRPRPRRRRRVAWVRLSPIIAAALAAFVAGAAVGRSGDDPVRDAAQDFADAWARGDYAAMHARRPREKQQDVPLARFAPASPGGAKTATLSRVTVGRASEPVA